MKHHIVIKFEKEWSKAPDPDFRFEIKSVVKVYDKKNLLLPVITPTDEEINSILDNDDISEVTTTNHQIVLDTPIPEMPEGIIDPVVVSVSSSLFEDDGLIKKRPIYFAKSNLDKITIDEFDNHILHIFMHEDCMLSEYDEAGEDVSIYEIVNFRISGLLSWYNNPMYKIIGWVINDKIVKYDRIREFNNEYMKEKASHPTQHLIMKTNKPIPKGYEYDPEIGGIHISFLNDAGIEEGIGTIWENWTIIPEYSDRSIIHCISNTLDEDEVWPDNDEYGEEYIPLTDSDNLERITGIRMYIRTEEVESIRVEEILGWDINNIEIDEKIIKEVNENLPTTLVKANDDFYVISRIFFIEENGERVKGDNYFIVLSGENIIAINLKDRSAYRAVMSKNNPEEVLGKPIFVSFTNEHYEIILEKKERLLDFVYDYGEYGITLLSNDNNNPSDLGDDQKYIAITDDKIAEVQEIFTVLVPPEEVDDTDFEEMFFKECMETDYDFSGYNPETNCYSYFKIIKEVI